MVERMLAVTARAGSAIGAAASSAVGLCPGAPATRTLRVGCGVLESVIVDPGGRLFFTSQTWGGWSRGALLRMETPDAHPVPIADGIDSPGGLAFAGDGRLIVGFGDSLHGGLIGNVAGRAGLLLVDPETGERKTWIRGLGMSNGVARAPDGSVFASNDFGTHIDRIAADGSVDRRWARVWSANGLAVDPSGRYLYAAQTFTRAAIKRIELANPGNITTHARPPVGAAAAMPDGLAVDAAGRLYVAANAAGQIWRIDPDGTICAQARGLRLPSAVALGHGASGFRAGNAYAVTFCGDVVELPDAVPPDS
jgi:DNA-binding beta-propeller fold protein YncE